jgi:hypothetical protein
MIAPPYEWPDGDHRPGNLRDRAGDVGGVGGDAAQRVGDGLHRDARVEQLAHDIVPPGAIGEGAMDQNDGRSGTARTLPAKLQVSTALEGEQLRIRRISGRSQHGPPAGPMRQFGEHAPVL